MVTSETNKTTPAYPRPIAIALVNTIDRRVKSIYPGENEEFQSRNDDYGAVSSEEVQLGKLLGTGGFSTVYELRGLSKPKKNDDNSAELKGASLYFNIRKTIRSSKRGIIRTKDLSDQAKRRRQHLQEQLENGSSNYVLKQLKPNKMVTAKTFAQAAADLFMEAQLLAELNHKNIISIHGWAREGTGAYRSGEYDAFFIILARLQGTLQDRIDRWRAARKTWKQLDILKSQNQLSRRALVSRITVVEQVASALKYLHSQNIVFRDLKPDNIGFDEFGTVKLFDFGLARHLPKIEEKNDVYKMSGKVGTIRYMAPECALRLPYNEKVDTYSWALVFWSCLTLEKPYDELSYFSHKEDVCEGGERPSLDHDEWPTSIKKLLSQSWMENVNQRLTMSKVSTQLKKIKADLQSELVESENATKMGPMIRRQSSISIALNHRVASAA